MARNAWSIAGVARETIQQRAVAAVLATTTGKFSHKKSDNAALQNK